MFIYLIKLAIIISITYAESEVYVRNQNDEIIAIFNSIPTQFGTLVPNNLIGRAIMANISHIFMGINTNILQSNRLL